MKSSGPSLCRVAKGFAAICLIVSCSSVQAFDLLGMGAASKTLKSTADELSRTVGKLPEQLQHGVGVNIAEAGQQMRALADKVDSQTVPLVHHNVVADLHHLSDLGESMNRELNAAARERITQLNADVSLRLKQTRAIMDTTIGETGEVVDEWIERTRDSAFAIEDRGAQVALVLMDRATVDVIRVASLVLLLIGLLVTGIKLLGSGGRDYDASALARLGVVSGTASVLLLLSFFATSAYLAVYPEELAKFSGQLLVAEREAACRVHDRRLSHLARIASFAEAELIEVTRGRIEQARSACAGG